jgi:hypothetical protein
MIEKVQFVGSAFIVIAVIALVLNQFLGLAIVSGDAGTEVNETVTVDYSNLTSLDVNADSYSNFTVYDSGDVELTEGTDYDGYSNGTIEWYNTTETTDGETATVTYSWSTTADGPFASVFSSLGSVGAAALTLLAIGLLIVAGRAIMQLMGGGF